MPNLIPATISTVALDNGNVRLKIVAEEKIIVDCELPGEQLGGIVSRMLFSAEAAMRLNGIPAPEGRHSPLDDLVDVPITSWGLVQSGAGSRQVIIISSGAAHIPFSFPEAKAHELGRSLINISWSAEAPLGSGALFRRLMSDFWDDLRGWEGVLRARCSAKLRRSVVSFSSKVSGRSVVVFRHIDIGPGSPVPEYRAVGHCVYCGATEYSTVPGVRRHPLGREHIIPEGLGGKLTLPSASCQECEHATGGVIEGQVLGTTLKALRVHLNLKKKGKGPHPETLPLLEKINGRERKIEIKVSDFPIIFMILLFPPPNFSPNASITGKPINGAIATMLKYDQVLLHGKYGISDFAGAAWDNSMFCRLLAKIAHCVTVAELGEDNFLPAHLALIRFGDVASTSMIGCLPTFYRVPPSGSLHEISVGYQRADGATYVVVLIRLFAAHRGPVYQVVVGKSLESPITRLKRVISSKISRILAR